jgi:hypothetical protein
LCVGARLKKTGAAVRKREEHKKHDRPCPKGFQLFFIQLKENIPIKNY